MDPSRWMENLGDKRNISIFSLSIPGSHDAMSFGVRNDSDFISTVEQKVNKNIGPIPLSMVTPYFSKWLVTQTKDPPSQLNFGIRYFHLRVAKHKNGLHFVHDLVACSLEFGLKEIAKFLKKRPKEIVILDFHEFFFMDDKDHAKLLIKFKEIFPENICPPFEEITLNKMHDNGYQIITIYRHQMCKFFKNTYWSAEVWPFPRPNTLEGNYLQEYLSKSVENRSTNIGLISPCILTPSIDTVIDYVFTGSPGKDGLKNAYAKQALKVLVPWIKNYSPPLNVAIADFIELNDGEFPNAVISLNLRQH